MNFKGSYYDDNSDNDNSNIGDDDDNDDSDDKENGNTDSDDVPPHMPQRQGISPCLMLHTRPSPKPINDKVD